MLTFHWRSTAFYTILLLIISSTFFTSCISYKKTLYFNDLSDTISATNPVVMTTVAYKDPVILVNDILAITIQTLTQNETNTPISSSTSALFNPLNGFLVDKSGFVEMELIGFVKVAGLTTTEARELIKQRAKEYYKEPVVNLRIANFDIYFMGEFGHNGSLSFPSEKVNIVEAIAAAGDLAITAKRNNILLIRTEGDQKKFVRFDMNSSQIFNSPYFYMKQRDIIYASPTKNKVQNSDNTFFRNISIITSVLGLAGLILAFRSK
jgi:polysaccharide export outer membrane protein